MVSIKEFVPGKLRKLALYSVGFLSISFSLATSTASANSAPTCSGWHGTVNVTPGSINNFGCWAMDMERDRLCLHYEVTPTSGASIFMWPYLNDTCHDFGGPGYPLDQYISYDPGPPGCGDFDVRVRYTQSDGQFCECRYTVHEDCPPGCDHVDDCGVCNGDGSSCAPPSTSPTPTPSPTPLPPCASGHYDACGICDGPNTSCDCTEEDLFPYNVQFDGNAQVMFHFHELIANKIRQYTGKYFANIVNQANAVYLESWRIANLSLPPVQLSCPSTMDCYTVSTVTYIDTLLKNNKTTIALTKKLINKAVKLGIPRNQRRKLEAVFFKKMKYVANITKLNAAIVPKEINVNCSPGF